MTYRKCTQCKDTTQDNLPLQRELRLQKDGHRDANNQNIRRDVKDGIGDHVIRFRGAIHYTSLLDKCLKAM
jgi:hypothetical protein